LTAKKTATWNGNLQPEVESNEYSSTRGSPTHSFIYTSLFHHKW